MFGYPKPNPKKWGKLKLKNVDVPKSGTIYRPEANFFRKIESNTYRGSKKTREIQEY